MTAEEAKQITIAVLVESNELQSMIDQIESLILKAATDAEDPKFYITIPKFGYLTKIYKLAEYLKSQGFVIDQGHADTIRISWD